MNNSVIDIIERFQRRYALQEEREMKNFHASTTGAGVPGVPDKNAMPGMAYSKRKKSMEKTQNEHA